MKISTLMSVITLVALASCSAAYQYGTAEQVTFKVEDKERVTKSNGDGGVTSQYLIFTDRGTYKASDSLWHWQWNSSDLYGSLKRGQNYKADIYGWRVGIFSMYPNITAVRAATVDSMVESYSDVPELSN